MVQYTVFPGRGGTPLQPQEFYIQTYVATYTPFHQTDWPLPGRSQPLDQFWGFNFAGSPWRIPPISNAQLRAPVFSAPQQPWRLDQTWTWSYNLNLIGKDRMTVGEQFSERPPLGPTPAENLKSWTWSYNLNLVGKDQLPTGEQIYDLATSQRLPDQIQLRSWQWSYNLDLIGQDQLPVGDILTALPPQLPVPIGLTWIASPAQSAAVTQVTFRGIWKSLPDQPVPPLIQTAFPNLVILQPTVITYIIRQSDWPLPQAPQQPTQSWTASYNLNLIGRDRFPTGEQVLDRPQLPVPPAQTWTASYNLNLIGQDRLPVGEAVSDLPPRDFARLFQTWISSVNAALVVTPAVLDILKQQRDWPVPRGAEPDHRRSWEWQYNKNLIGQDALPFRQRDWPLPTISAQAVQTWIDQTKILLAAVQRPFVQTDWPLSSAPQQAAQSWTANFNLNLIGQDRLPFRQSDWPLTPAQGRSADLATWIDRVKLQLFTPFAQLDWPNPRAPQQPAQSWTSSFPLTLVGQDRLPNRQQDWPLSSAHIPAPLQIMLAGTQIILIPPAVIPPGVAHAGMYTSRPDLRSGTAADLYNLAVSPQVPPVVTGLIPLRTLVGTGI